MKKILYFVLITALLCTLLGCADTKNENSDENSISPIITHDYLDIEKLDSQALDWGPGGPRDEDNRSVGAIKYNEEYQKYDAYFIAEDTNTVYLTFDEGYNFGFINDVLDVLKEKEVKAMFFITYDFATQAPESVQRMLDEGHVVGNHSYSHKKYAELTPQEMAEDISKMHSYISDNFGYDMQYFRFPAGNFSEQSLALVQQMDYKSIFWSFAYVDWETDNQPDPTQSLEKLLEATCPGNIYLLHSVSETNKIIMADFLDGVIEKGYTWGDPSSL